MLIRKSGLAAIVCVAAAGSGVMGSDVFAQEAYFSVEGQITSSTGIHRMFFDLDRAVDSSENLRFQTYTGSGGINAAGDVITASGFDSVLNLFNGGAGGIVAENDDGSTGRDSLLSWPGVASNGVDVLSPDPLPALSGYRLTVSNFGNNNTGPWAVDLIGPADALTLTNLSPTATSPGGVSQLDSLKFGTRLGGAAGPLGPVPATFNYAVGSTLEIEEDLVVANTGNAQLNQSNGLIEVVGLTRVNSGGVANLTGGTLTANGGVLLDGGTFLRGASSTFNLGPGQTFTGQNNATANVSGSLTVDGGTAYNFNSGSDLAIINGGLNIGGETSGSVVVDGVGSSLFVMGFTAIGQPNSTSPGVNGSLTIRNDATATLGTVAVSSDFLPFATGEFSVLSGAKATADNVSVGTAGSASSSASLTIGGTGTTGNATLTQNGASTFAVGNFNNNTSTGRVDINAGGTLNTGTGAININESGAVRINGGTLFANGDVFLNDGELRSTVVGQDGFNLASGRSLTANGNSTVAFDNGNYRLDGNTTFNLNDGSTLTTAGFLTVGGGSSGTLNVGDASTPATSPRPSVTITGNTDIGLAGGTGIVNVRNGATANFNNGLDIGLLANLSTGPTSGTLNVTSLGKVNVAGNINLGTSPNASGTAVVTVDGGGSFDTEFDQLSGDLTIGNNNGSGTATLNVLERGEFYSTFGGTFTVNATGTVNGSGRLRAQGDLIVDGGTVNDISAVFGKLTVRNNGQFTFNNPLYTAADNVLIESGGDAGFGFYGGGGSAVVTTVAGTGSTFTAFITELAGTQSFTARNSAAADVGDLILSGLGPIGFGSPSDDVTFRVESGATATAFNVEIAQEFGGSGTGSLTVTGTNSTFNQTGSSTLQIGKASGGSGTLAVEAGGTFTTGLGFIRVNDTGTINVSGGTFNARADLDLTGGTVNLTAGTLTADTVDRAAGSFNFTGGTLDVANFNGNLDQDGGILDLRDDAAGTLTTIDGRYQNEGGTLALFATLGTGPLLDVNGLTQLGPGSTLQVELNPDAANLGDNDSIVLIQSAAGIQGTFENEIITSPSGLLYEITYTNNAVRLSAITAALLAGDYNGNGTVDAADYTVWQDSFGSTVNLAADGNGNGIIDAADYTVWQDNFGSTLVGGANFAALTAVPEPGTFGVVAAGLLWGLTRRRQNAAA